MLDHESIWQSLDDIGLHDWQGALQDLVKERLSGTSHGDFPRWQEIVEQLLVIEENQTENIRDLLLQLVPWRKGPFELAGITIDSEWRSDLKWDRLKDAIAPLDGREVLDIGCGNGYYAVRMREAGARSVIGLEPMQLYVLQFLVVQRFLAIDNIFVLPVRFEEIPGDSGAFDTCFSMGVLYHQHSSMAHLAALKETLRPGGELVLETLYVEGGDVSWAFRPQGRRYARMRNVYQLPTIAKLTEWLEVFYTDIRIVDESRTSVEEQRTTEWMPFQSLAEALDPSDPSRTVEGWPAPRRVIVLANAP